MNQKKSSKNTERNRVVFGIVTGICLVGFIFFLLWKNEQNLDYPISENSTTGTLQSSDAKDTTGSSKDVDPITEESFPMYTTESTIASLNDSKSTKAPENTTKETTTTSDSLTEPSLTEKPKESTQQTAPTESVKTNHEDTVFDKGELEGDGKKISLPYTLPNSNVSIDRINTYSGVFIEDHSDRELKGIIAAAITNHGTEPVEFGSFVLREGKENLIFEFSCLPAGATMLVMEKNASTFHQGVEYLYVNSTVASFAYGEGLLLLSDKIELYLPKNTEEIRLSNKTAETIKVRVLYKYISPEGIYIGGTTYSTAEIEIKPGDTIVGSPSHYEGENSKIMRIVQY